MLASEIDTGTITERPPDGAVEVTVAASGALLGLRCSELVRTMPPRQIAATIQHCLRAAGDAVNRRFPWGK